MITELLPSDVLPEWFSYPESFTDALRNGLRDIGQWQILDGKWLFIRHGGLKKRFPDRNLVPFARRLDNDDVACWENVAPTEVRVIHDFCKPGWENREDFRSFEDWLLAARMEAADFEN